MAQGTITRLTYERIGVLLTDAPAYKESDSKLNDLIRVQSLDYAFSHQSLDVKSIGSDKLVTRNNVQSPVVRAPDVNCNIEYLFSEGQNETNANLHIGNNASILSNFFNSSFTDDVNVLVVASDKDSHRDVNFLSLESDFNDYNVIGIGNAFLANYRYTAAVGAFPTCSLSYAASNMKFDVYAEGDGPKLPAVKLGMNNTKSSEKLSLNGDVFQERHDPEVSTIKPGDIKVTIIKSAGSRGGVDLTSVHAAIQSISIDLPLPRQDIYGMGSNFVFNRKLKLPIIGKLDISMVLRGYTQDEVNSFLTQTDVYDIKIDHPIKQRISRNIGDIYVGSEKLFILVEEGLWKNFRFIEEQGDSGVVGQEYISDDGNFFYVCMGSTNWAKISISASNVSFSGFNVNDKHITENFVNINTSAGWRRFPVLSIDFENLFLTDALNISNNITFEINRAQLKEQNYTHAIGSDVMVSTALSFDVTKKDGLKLFFRFVPRVKPSWSSNSEVLQFPENSTSPVNYTYDLNEGDSQVYYSLTGEDSSSFDVNQNGVISFFSPPNYPSGKIVYNVSIIATNDTGSDKKDITINITN